MQVGQGVLCGGHASSQGHASLGGLQDLAEGRVCLRSVGDLVHQGVVHPCAADPLSEGRERVRALLDGRLILLPPCVGHGRLHPGLAGHGEEGRGARD